MLEKINESCTVPNYQLRKQSNSFLANLDPSKEKCVECIRKCLDTTNQHSCGYELLDISEASAFLKLKMSNLRNHIFRKEIPFYRFNRLIRFKKEDLLEWVEKKKVK